MAHEPESSIAKVRNQLSPIVNYFAMRRMIDEGNLHPEEEDYLKIIIEEQYQFIQNGNMEKLLSLIKDNSIW